MNRAVSVAQPTGQQGPMLYPQQMSMDASQSGKLAHEQTALWAQQNYFIDSGIQTAAVPTASSLISGLSGASSMLDDYGDPYGTTYPQDPLTDVNAEYEASRTMRIRAAIFPETVSEPMNVTSSQFDFGQSTNVQRLTEPGQMLKTAVVNIINYQDDAELAVKVIPDLVRLLSDQDTVVVSQAVQFSHHISKIDAISRVLASHPELIEAVLRLVNSADPEITKHVVGTLYNVSGHANGLLAIFRSGGIEALVKLLESPVDSVIYYAITTLHNLILHQQGSKDAIRSANGVPRMVALLRTKTLAKFLAIVVDCLYNLVFNHSETKIAFLQSGGPAELVRILTVFDYEKLLWTVSRLIQALSICGENKKAIIAAGGLQALATHLSHPSHRLVRTILLGLRNLSDAALRDDNVEQLLAALLQLMGSSDYEVVLCCVCILSNLSCNNVRNKATICRKDGVKSLLRTLETFMGLLRNNPEAAVDLLEPTLCTLRHITVRHVDAEVAQNEMRLYRCAAFASHEREQARSGLDLIASFVQPGVRLMLARPALGVVRNVANSALNAQLLGQSGVVAQTCQLMAGCYSQLQSGGGPSPVVDGVKCMEMLETCVGALQLLCKHPQNRAAVARGIPGALPILVRLLYFDVETVQCYSVGTLSELAADPDGALAIEQRGAVPRLTELLHARNENIATYAASVLHTLSRNKPEDYRKHLGIELTTSLLREDTAPWSREALNDMPQVTEDGFDVYGGFMDVGDLMEYETMDSGASAGQRRTTATSPPASFSATKDKWRDTNL